MERKLKALTANFIARCILVMMLVLFSIQGIRAQCLTMPEPVNYTVVSQSGNTRIEERATINGITVTRILEVRGNPGDKLRYSNEETIMNSDYDNKDTRSDETYCGKSRKATFGTKKYPFMDSNKVSKITYKFSKPVMDAEVFLAAFGYNGIKKNFQSGKLHQDRVVITTNSGGSTNLNLRSSCESGAATIESGNKVVSSANKTTDVKVGVTATEPFTELYLQVEEKSGQTGGYGFFVEICLETLTLDNAVCSPETPTDITDPFGGSSAATKVAIVNGVQVTRKMSISGSAAVSSIGTINYCGSSKTYPANLPLVGWTGNSQIIYEFDKPVNNTEVILYAFGDMNHQGTFDEVEFEVNGGGSLSIQKIYECNVGVSNITGRRLKSVTGRVLTDVGIKLVSTQPFTQIKVIDKSSTGFGYTVALCPSSVQASLESYNCTPATIGSNFANQTVATAKMNNVTVTRTLGAGVPMSTIPLTSNHCGSNVNYPVGLPLLIGNKQITYDFSTPIQSAEVFLYYFGDNLNEGTKDKVKFAVNNGIISLNRVYDCYPGATIINSDNTVESVTKKLTTDAGIRVTSTTPFTRITLTDVNSNGGGYYVVICPTSIKVPPFSGGQCSSGMPTPLFVGTNTATVNGIQVNINRPAGTERTTDYSTASVTTCQAVYKAGTTFLHSNKAVTYKFSQPVNNVEVKMALMGANKEQPNKRDAAKFTTNCTTAPTLTLVSDCVGYAAVDNNIVWADGAKGVDVGVKVTSAKPFTELTITDVNSEANGYFVDLCPASIKKQGTGETDPVTITTQLTATTTACVGFTTSLTTQATLASPFTGNLNYQWQKSTNNGTTWSDISGQSASAASGANVTYSFVPVASDNNTLYRVVYTYTHAGSFCGTMSLTTDATKLVANTVSSVITVNAPTYTDVAVCASATGTTTITAKATLNTGMGGTILTYQLQYRPTTASPWVDHAIQKYTGVASGAEKILTIENVASNTGYYRVKYTSNASVCGGGESYSNIFKFDALTATNVITINPATYPNKTVCSGSSFTINAQATVATGTIANDGSGNKFAYELQYKANSSANWALYTLPNGGAAQIYSNNTKVGATRTFNISTENIATGGKFRVKYSADITDLCDDITVYSDEFTVTIDELDVTNITATPLAFKQGENTSVSFVIEGTPGAQVTFKVGNGAEQTQTINAAGQYNVPPQTTNQTLELSVTKVKKGTCEKTYTDKKGRAQATTAACTTKPAVQYPAPVGQGQTAVMNGVTVTRKFLGKPSIYGNSDTGTYCSGTVYHHYTIIHNNLPSQFSNAVTYVFSKPVTSAEVWLMVLSSPAPGSYDEVQLSTNNGNLTFTKIYDCLGGAGAVTLTPGGKVTSKPSQVNDVAIRVSSDKPFTELTVTDVRAAGSTSGVLVELCPTSVTPANTITITTQPQNKTICANEMATFTSKAQLQNATGNIQYKWQQSNNGTNWTDIASSQGTITSGATASLTTAGIANNKYRVVYSYKFTADVVVTATSQEVTLTKLPSVALPTLSGNMTLCPTATPNNVSFTNYVTAPAGTTLLWYTTPTAVFSSTTAPNINRNVTTRTTKTAYVRALNSNGCTSGVVTVTLTVNDTTAPTFNAPAALNIVCNSATATAAINTWLGTATATDTCGAIATITNDYTAPANLCNVSGGVITVTFVAKDTFGNVLTKTSTIKLGTSSLTVVKDEITAGNGLTATTTTSVLANDRLNGNVPTAGPTGTVSITNVTAATPIHGGNVPSLDVNTGKVTVPANTPAGTYTISYKICEAANTGNCTSTTVAVKVVTPTLTVTPDNPTVSPSTTAKTIPSVLDNDSIGGVVTPTAGPGGNVTMTVTNPSGTNVPTMDPNTGKVTVPGNTPAGSYTITYNYCEVLNPTNCTGTKTVVVTVGATSLTVVSDTITINNGSTATTSTESILDNDSLGGNTPTAGPTGSVTLTVVTPATPIGGNVPSLDVNTGKVTVPAGTPAGTYTITYKECEVLNPSSNCKTDTVVVKVGAASLTVTPDSPTVSPSTSTQTTPSILDNDSIGGVVTPTAGPGGNVTMTVTNPSGTNLPTMDPNTGKVTVPGNTPAGSYTITYNYCEVLNPTNCTGTKTVVVTVGAASLTVVSDTITINNGSTATTSTESILDNDSLGGNTPTAGPSGSVTLTVTNPAMPINGGSIPTLDVNTGKVIVPAGTTSGTYTITYKECESLNPSSNCHTQTVVVKVGAASLTIVPDTLTVTPSTSTQTIPSILNNDKIGGVVTPTAGPGGNVTMTVTNPSGSNVPTMDPNTGIVTVPGNTPAGSYTITYSYCEVLNPTNCTGVRTAVVTVVPVPTVVTTPDSFTRTGTATVTTPSVLNNDRIVNPDGSTTTPVIGTNVTITNVVVTPSPAPGQPTPTLNPDGTVTVPGNLAPGNYTITYDVCSLPIGITSCTTGVMTVTVLQPAPLVRPDSFVVTGTSTQTTPSIFDNDDFVNPDGSVSSVTTGTLTITNVVVSPIVPGNPTPVMNPDGTITIPNGMTPGNYTITYDVCTTATPTNCTTGVLTMTIMPTVVPVAVDDSATTAKGTPVTISVLANDTLNGAVIPTVVTHPTNGTAVENTDGTIEYRPYTGFVGTDSFVYEICNGAGCSSATVTVKITGDIIVYNGVSLNGSDKNNHFHIGGIENYPNNKVRIYNRWGVEVFSVEGYDNVTKVFKGISDGRVTVEASDRLPQGTYYYIIEYVDDHNKTQTEVGWLYLKKN